MSRAPPPEVPSLRVHLAVNAPEHENAAESAPRGKREVKEDEEEGRQGGRGEAAGADVGLDVSEVRLPAVRAQGRPFSASASNASARHRFSRAPL